MSFRGNIEKLSIKNKNYRKVLHSTANMQVVLMSLKPSEEIGTEIHRGLSQFIRVESGTCKAIIADKRYYLKDGDAIVVAPNTYHNIINTGDNDVKLYTIYSKPIHSTNCIQKHKDDNEC